MARIAYVPYDETMAEIFSTCGITIQDYSFGEVQGWYDTDYSAARGAAWEWLIDNGTDQQWEDWEDLLTGDYNPWYWSTDSGHMPT